jgi:serine protease SohB
MEVLWDTVGFAGKGVIVFFVFAACTLVFFARAARAARAGRSSGGHLRVQRLNDALKHSAERLRGAMMKPKEYKARRKALAKAAKTESFPQKNLFVLDFKGDILASAVENLRHEITALCEVAAEGDEVVVRLESAGGAVHSYGFAASQLARIRSKGLELTVCVDRVAASGGYMMACVAERIVAAPFAILGSIGVVSPMPNLHRLLDKFGIDYENFTAGEYKRTVSPLAEITPKGRKKYQEQLEEVHQLFKDHVHENRPSVDIDEVATGEHWHGIRAAELGLVNELMTSDDYLISKVDDANIYKLSFRRPRNVRDRLSGFVRAASGSLMDTLQERSGVGV